MSALGESNSKLLKNVKRSEEEALRMERNLAFFVESAISTKEATKERIEFIKKTPEPLYDSNLKWMADDGCCLIS